MKISIGIMLWNEEKTIGMTIDSVFQQTLLTEAKLDVESVEVVALANGCTDQSIPRAREAFERNLKACPLPYVTARVEELPKGRSPAWNKFVHTLTPPDTDYIFFMDADIYINHPNALWSMVEGLAGSDYHPVAAALAIKDVDLKERRSLWERLSSVMTAMEHKARLTYLCGGLYCGRASFFRRFEFPNGFVCGDDGFIARLAITNLLTTEFQFDRILHPKDASFVFEAYRTIPRLFRQHRRRQVGLAIWLMILDYVKERQVNGSPDAGTIIRRACAEDPDWLREYALRRIAEKGFWVLPLRDVLLRLSQWKRLSLSSRIVNLPLVLGATLWHAAVLLSANFLLRTNRYQNVWENMQNTSMLSIGPLMAERSPSVVEPGNIDVPALSHTTRGN